jgi:hypothetical protein
MGLDTKVLELLYQGIIALRLALALPFRYADWEEKPGMSSGRNKKLVAIVDDDESVRSALHGLMKSVGLPARAFASAEDFLESGQRRLKPASTRGEPGFQTLQPRRTCALRISLSKMFRPFCAVSSVSKSL